jgi:D-alanyl-D-alanine carboxypeptidase
VAAAALSACAAPANVPPPPEATPTRGALAEAAALQQALDDSRSRLGFPGVIARVIRPGAGWDGVSGAAAPGGTRPPAADDRTRVGSLTKTMTATIVLQLSQEGLLSLDEPISRYVPDLPNPDATISQVMDMTSGIPSYTLDQEITDAYLSRPWQDWTPEQLLDGVRTLPAEFPPGTGWQYSNSNYVALGVLIEKVTGKPVADVFQERIFGPLGMSSSSFPMDDAIPAPYLAGVTAQGAEDGQTRDATRWSPSFAFTAGQVVSTMDDLERWAHALFTGEGVLDPATQRLRRDSILSWPPPNSATAGYGYGIGNRDGWWGHDGDIPGYTTSVVHNYQTDTTIIVIVNSDIPDDETGLAPAPYVLAQLQAALG